MDHDWEQRGIWVEARVARSFVHRSGSAVHGWVRWADGTYGTFQGQSSHDVTARFPPGGAVDVLVHPSKRARTYRMALDAPAAGPIDHGYAEPADEPAVVSGLLQAFSGGTGGKERPRASGLGSGMARPRPPRAARSPWPPLAVGMILLIVGLVLVGQLTRQPFAGMGFTIGLIFPAAFCLAGLALSASVLWPMLALAALRRTGQQVPAVVIRSREVLDDRGWIARFRWQVVATATIDGQARELMSEDLRDDPVDAVPPGTLLTALVDPNNRARYRLLLPS